MISKARKLLFLLALSFLVLSQAANAQSTGVAFAEYVALNGDKNLKSTDKSEIRNICLSGGRPATDCSYVSNMKQAICLAGGRPAIDCNYVSNLKQAICLSGGRPSINCTYVSDMKQAVCLAGGRTSIDCNYVSSMNQAVCLTSGVSSIKCNYVSNIGTAICLNRTGNSLKCSNIDLNSALKLKRIDFIWAWDKFRNPNAFGNIWACRGMQTGQFAEDAKCRGKMKTDSIWPNN